MTESNVSAERLQEMLDGLEGVTPGPWEAGHWGDGSGGDSWIISVPSIEVIPVQHVAFKQDAAHIARCDPDTIRYLVTQELSLRAAAKVRAIREGDGEVVKPLQWHDNTEGHGCPIRFAAWPLHGYRIHLYQWGEADTWAVQFGTANGVFLPKKGDAEAAKAMVQAEWSDYLQRAALAASPIPATGGEKE